MILPPTTGYPSMFKRVQINSKGKRTGDIFKDERSNPKKISSWRDSPVLYSTDHQTNSSGLKTFICLEILINKLLELLRHPFSLERTRN